MLMLKILHYLSYKHHFLLGRPAENGCVLDVCGRDAFGSFRRFRRLTTCYNWVSNDAIASLLSAHIFTIISVKILHKCHETSLTVTSIVAGLTLK